jgi:hypothetical protein
MITFQRLILIFGSYLTKEQNLSKIEIIKDNKHYIFYKSRFSWLPKLAKKQYRNPLKQKE